MAIRIERRRATEPQQLETLGRLSRGLDTLVKDYHDQERRYISAAGKAPTRDNGD